MTEHKIIAAPSSLAAMTPGQTAIFQAQTMFLKFMGRIPTQNRVSTTEPFPLYFDLSTGRIIKSDQAMPGSHIQVRFQLHWQSPLSVQISILQDETPSQNHHAELYRELAASLNHVTLADPWISPAQRILEQLKPPFFNWQGGQLFPIEPLAIALRFPTLTEVLFSLDEHLSPVRTSFMNFSFGARRGGLAPVRGEPPIKAILDDTGSPLYFLMTRDLPDHHRMILKTAEALPNVTAKRAFLESQIPFFIEALQQDQHPLATLVRTLQNPLPGIARRTFRFNVFPRPGAAREKLPYQLISLEEESMRPRGLTAIATFTIEVRRPATRSVSLGPFSHQTITGTLPPDLHDFLIQLASLLS